VSAHAADRAQAWIGLAPAVTSGGSADSKYHLRTWALSAPGQLPVFLVRRCVGLAAVEILDVATPKIMA